MRRQICGEKVPRPGHGSITCSSVTTWGDAWSAGRDTSAKLHTRPRPASWTCLFGASSSVRNRAGTKKYASIPVCCLRLAPKSPLAPGLPPGPCFPRAWWVGAVSFSDACDPNPPKPGLPPDHPLERFTLDGAALLEAFLRRQPAQSATCFRLL